MSNNQKSRALELLKLLQFKLDENNYWTKQYADCEIKVILQKSEIVYPADKIIVHDRSTSNFDAKEDLVVLECVDRLLGKGYPANKIELEKRWRLGRNDSGRLDILVRCRDNDEIYLMIECKTYPDQYKNELQKMQENGGQLFTYFQQDRSANFLCLYSSRIDTNRIAHECSVVPITRPLSNARSMDEMLKKWDKQIKRDGVFDNGVMPYQVQF